MWNGPSTVPKSGTAICQLRIVPLKTYERMSASDAASLKMPAPVTRALDETVQRLAPPAALDEAGFRARHAEDAMAREKLEEGIRKFAADQQQLEALLAAKLG